MNLAIDIGNTRTKMGLFEGAGMVAGRVVAREALPDLLSWATNQKVENIILSTVGASVDPELEDALRRQFHYVRLEADTPLPIENRYQTPHTLGKDRLAAIVGAFQLYPYTPCLVIDAGTCITYDILSREAAYLGGNISPGVVMRLRAMHEFTANLPAVAPASTENWIGSSTELAMRLGAQEGALLEMDGFIARCRSEMRQIRVILTGGDADFFAKKLKSEIFVNHHLVLIGLNKILTYNVGQLE